MLAFVPSVMFLEPCFLMAHAAEEDPAFVTLNLMGGFLAGIPAILAGDFYGRHQNHSSIL